MGKHVHLRAYFLIIILSWCSFTALWGQEEKRDIETASFYELTDWLRSLGLSESGRREALEKRLLEYYNLQEPAEPAEPADDAAEESAQEAGDEEPVQGSADDEDDTTAAEESALQIITIESAHEATAMTLEVVDEEFIRLRGDVVLRVRNEETGEVHSLQAATVEFNQKQERLTARGGVYYSKEGAEDAGKSFQAQEISFQINNWAGLFIQGRSEKTRKIEDEDILFYFMGDRIYTADKDIIILDKGTITSSNPDEPYYRIDAKKIWLLGPGEWGLSHGILRIGRIPMFYLPFFYNPGDEMVINPVIGYRVKEGSYIQTTTYFQGRKTDDESALSFMKIAGDSGKPREQKLVGLYLRQQDEFLREEDPGYFKIMLDYYSNLGIFSGLEGEWDKTPWADKIFFSFGLARSRNIYASGTSGLYSPYNSLAGVDSSIWHDMTLPWGDEWPLRWGLKFTGNWKLGSLSLEHYSDPSYNKDFSDRAETFNWIDYLYRKEAEQSSTENEISSFLWKFQGRWTAPLPDMFKPYVKNLSLSQFSTQLTWQSRNNPEYETEDPRSSFYYINNGEFPSLRLSVSGDIFSYPFNERRQADRGGPDNELIPPWQEDEEEEIAEDEDIEVEQEILLEPDYLNSTSTETKNQFFTGSLGYNLYTQQNLSAQTDNDDWSAIKDVRYEPDLALYNTVNNIDLTAKMNFINGSIVFSDASNFNHRYRNHYNLTEYDEPQWDSLIEGDYGYNRLLWSNKLSLQLFWLRWLKWFDKSTAEYRLNTTLLDRSFLEMDGEAPQYENTWYDGTEDTVSQHEGTVSLIFDPADQRQVLKYKHAFEPLEDQRELSLDAGYKNDYWGSRVNNALSFSENEWDWENVRLSLDLTPWKFLSLSNALQFDPEELNFPENKASFVLGPVKGYFDFADAPLYVWDNLEWQQEGGTQFHLTKVTGKIDWKPSVYYLWFNRVYIKPQIRGDMHFNMDKINDSALSLNAALQFRISEFLDLSLSVKSSNTFIYRYLPNVSEEVFGIPSLDPVEDLLMSVDFFNWLSEDSRENSHFNMETLSFDITHHLSDWDLQFTYSAAPELKTDDNQLKYYEWVPTFTILVQWNPIPEIITKLSKDDDGWEIKSRED